MLHPVSTLPAARTPVANVTLVLGGTRSGKSELAERLAEGWTAPVTYVATGQVTDPDMAGRIAAHRKRRPSSWTTVEATGPELPKVLGELPGPALVDSLGTWVASYPDLDPDPSALCAALSHRAAHGAATILVSEEVGLGVHAPTEAGRRFADRLGELNRAVADLADQVLLVVAGRPFPLPHLDDLT
jgi:adenosyl cobinamide kinase/adenosyl cobinamide phosphate guanylyltransferase